MAEYSPREERRIGWLTALAWSPRGRQLAVASGETIHFYSWSSEAGLSDEPLRKVQGHEAPIRCITFHPKGNILASGGADGRIILWRSDGKGQCIDEWQEAVAALAFSSWG